jgi:hypothetical protein
MDYARTTSVGDCAIALTRNSEGHAMTHLMLRRLVHQTARVRRYQVF